MNKKTARRQRDLKSKLLAAVAMLLVSSMMMVTSTYAWFTLSTAPEVTGITTAVGANGNLEMALQPYSGVLSEITSTAGDGALAVEEKNLTWGNLVDVSNNAVYGMNNLVLYPAELNKTGDNITLGAPLKTPVYGADGRINKLDANTTTGAYDTGKSQFAESMTVGTGETATTITNAKGVRAIGTSSSLTARELAHRNALATAISEKSGANIDASRTLNQNGSAIGDIAIRHALGLDSAGYSWSEIAPLYTAVTDLEAVAGRIEKALINYLLAYNIAPAAAEETYADLVTAFASVNTLSDANAVTGIQQPTDTSYTAAVAELGELKAAINAAKAGLEAQRDKTGIQWSALSTSLSGLVDLTKITVNSMTMEQINREVIDEETQEKTYPGRDELVQNLSNNNYTALIDMPNGSGVFSDIAAFVGEYSGAFKMSVKYGTMTLPVNTVMTAKATPKYLSDIAASNAIVFVSATGGSSTNPISTFYGYIIDLAFRTNAANSSLQLQADAIDRIYKDGSNESTMGGGAYMSFETDSSTFGVAGVKSLMENIRIIFFDTATGKIYSTAKLDATAAETNATTGKIKMPIVLTDADGAAKTDKKIMDLNQNEAHALSVMVYLDGNAMTNADVAADAAQSMYGSMNLQFSSSATLKPMEYNDLRNGTSSVTPTDEPVTLNNVTATTGYTVSNAKKQGNNIGFQLTAENGNTLEGKTVTVDFGGSKTATATKGTVAGVTGYGVTIPAGVTVEATTQITVTVTDANP